MGRGQAWNPIERLVIEITSPFQKIIKSTIHTIEELWTRYFALVNLHQENVNLKKQLDALRIENSRFRESLQTYGRLEALLKFKRSTQRPVVAAQVIGWDPSGWFKSVVIDKGEKDGLKTDMPVVNAMGVVGRLVSVSANYAKVLLIFDQNSAVDCVIQRSREKGILKGLAQEISMLHYVLKTADIKGGDLVVTSGMGRVFPKGIPVGEVVQITDRPGELFKTIKVRLSVDFSNLEEVLVILKEDPLKGDQDIKG
jgi:rod shape-determining protein MreC